MNGDGQSDPNLVHRLNAKFAHDMLARLTSLSNVTRGLFAETLVADLLGSDAVFNADPYGAWDILWGTVEIQVKCSGAVQAWRQSKPSPPRWSVTPRRIADEDGRYAGAAQLSSHVWVFARHEGANHLLGWTFYALPVERLIGPLSPAVEPRTITIPRLLALGAVVSGQTQIELQRAVRAASTRGGGSTA